MKHPRLGNSLFFALALSTAAWSHAGAAQSSATHEYVVDDSDIAGVMAADDERVAALIARDRDRLEAIHSPDLRYAHSNGTVEDRDTYISGVMEGKSGYLSFDYQHRTFKPIAPGIVLMTGRVLVGLQKADGPITLDLNFLAVWRQENGRWCFLAWQSSRNPPPPAPAPAN